MRCQLAREDPGKAFDSRFRGDVYRFTFDCEGYAQRGKVDDAAESAPDQCGRSLLTAVDRTEAIRLENSPNRFRGCRDDEVHRRDSGRVDQRIDTFVPPQVVHGSSYRSGIGHVYRASLERRVDGWRATKAHHPVASCMKLIGTIAA